MNTTTKAATEKAKNYSDEQVAILQSFDRITYAQALELAEQFGKKPRSVISKVHNLKIPYEPKPKPEKRIAKETKSELVAIIENNLDADGQLDGLEKATVRALNNLLAAVNSVIDGYTS